MRSGSVRAQYIRDLLLPILLVALTGLVVVSCNGRTDSLPGIAVPSDQMNIQLKLLAPPEANSFKMGTSVRLVASNDANGPIVFPQDYGVKIFRNDNNRWVEVGNSVDYTPGNKTLLPKAQQALGGIIVPIHPAVQDNQPVTVRVVLVGKMGDKAVGASIDIVLQP